MSDIENPEWWFSGETKGYSVGDRVNVPGKGLGSVCYIHPRKNGIVVKFDKPFTWRNNYRTISQTEDKDIVPWGCGIHEDCALDEGLAHACLLSRIGANS